jgi:hypothetical protein
MAQHTTLLEFLEDAGARVRVYDLGRRVVELEREMVLAFEKAAAPYPLPMQHKAWIALVQLVDDRTGEPVIWFLRLDLDEQGLLIQAERDYLLSRLLESAQARVEGADPQAMLRDNPYAFSPREDRMAQFHALLARDLGLPPSRFYAHALEYFSGKPGWGQWSFVGYQGIADVACRHHGEPLSTAIAMLPGEPLVALAHCLENERLSAQLRDALLQRLDRELGEATPNAGIVAALIRAVSRHAAEPPVKTALHRVLDHPSGNNIEWLVAIAGRAWEALGDDDLLARFLERLAANDHGQAAFEHCIADLLSLPDQAARTRQALRSADATDTVRAAFARMTEHATTDA